MNAILLIVLAGFMQAARSFTETTTTPGHGTALAFGYMLLSAQLAGDLFRSVGLPRITGYLALGLVAGPGALDLVTPVMVENLGLVNGAAIFLIALTAGLEMEMHAIRPLLRSLAWISLIAVLGTTLLLAGTCMLLRDVLHFLRDMPYLQALAVSMVLGTVMVAQSPAVVVALRNETSADGPVIRTVLAVVVLADLVVIVLFALTSATAKAAFGAPGTLMHTLAPLGWQVLGSLVVGAVLGGLVAVYLRKVRSGAALFVLTVAVVTAEVGGRLDLDPLLVALMTGMVVRNLTATHGVLGQAIERSSVPVYAVFFAVAGAKLHLASLSQMFVPLAVLFVVRVTGLVGGTRIAARIASAPAAVGRYAGWGLVPQAGLALALAVLLADLFPELGQAAASLTVGLVALNELIGPVIFRISLLRSGEGGRRLFSTEGTSIALAEPSESEALALEGLPRGSSGAPPGPTV